MSNLLDLADGTLLVTVPGGSEVKAPASNAGDLGSIPGLGRSPGEGNGNPLQCSCLGNSMHGQRSLVVCSPWDHEELDRTERLSTHTRGNFAGID